MIPQVRIHAMGVPLLLSAIVFVAVGCGNTVVDGVRGACTVGESRVCGCLDGGSGAQICGVDGQLGLCLRECACPGGALGIRVCTHVGAACQCSPGADTDMGGGEDDLDIAEDDPGDVPHDNGDSADDEEDPEQLDTSEPTEDSEAPENPNDAPTDQPDGTEGDENVEDSETPGDDEPDPNDPRCIELEPAVAGVFPIGEAVATDPPTPTVKEGLIRNRCDRQIVMVTAEIAEGAAFGVEWPQDGVLDAGQARRIRFSCAPPPTARGRLQGRVHGTYAYPFTDDTFTWRHDLSCTPIPAPGPRLRLRPWEEPDVEAPAGNPPYTAPAVRFGDVPSGVYSLRILTIENPGPVPLRIQQPAWSFLPCLSNGLPQWGGDCDMILLHGIPATGAIIPVGASLRVEVGFQPPQVGTTVVRTLHLRSNAEDVVLGPDESRPAGLDSGFLQIQVMGRSGSPLASMDPPVTFLADGEPDQPAADHCFGWRLVLLRAGTHGGIHVRELGIEDAPAPHHRFEVDLAGLNIEGRPFTLPGVVPAEKALAIPARYCHSPHPPENPIPAAVLRARMEDGGGLIVRARLRAWPDPPPPNP